VNLPNPLLDNIVTYLINKEQEKPKGHYPSSAYKCIRQMWYKWNEIPTTNPITAAAALRMQYGISIHEGFAKILKDMDYDMLEEMKGEKHISGLVYPIRYRVDFLFAGKDHTTVGGEIKSTFGRGVKELQDTGKPREHDLPQLVTYAYCTEIPWWILVYLGRDNAYYTEFYCHYSFENDTLTTYQAKDGKIIYQEQYDNMMSEVIARFKMTEDTIQEKEPPPKEFWLAIKNGQAKRDFQHNKVTYKSDWQCSYCNWCDLCWAEELKKYAHGNNTQDYNE